MKLIDPLWWILAKALQGKTAKKVAHAADFKEHFHPQAHTACPVHTPNMSSCNWFKGVCDEILK